MIFAYFNHHQWRSEVSGARPIPRRIPPSHCIYTRNPRRPAHPKGLESKTKDRRGGARPVMKEKRYNIWGMDYRATCKKKETQTKTYTNTYDTKAPTIAYKTKQRCKTR
ncbi:hypothetical protein AVEN_7674-1 [Araneus ventricosus]|uniref:Uncharacterized protein n=1 Tax=Araneus ventricosus TaxID=182803 RepID=A0A4Y2S3R8_ARAVE|nr:hypothetical protein AVEN_7674-1 [Araneus ventricosus]